MTRLSYDFQWAEVNSPVLSQHSTCDQLIADLAVLVWVWLISEASSMATVLALASLLATLLCLVLPQNATASTKASIDAAELRATQTIEGLFSYYWKKDPTHRKISFFFSCAQIGDIGSSTVGHCSCYNPSSCVNCYRWWSAVALESVATYGIYMNIKNHSKVPAMFYSHSPYNADWNATASCTYVDDFLWYGIAYLRVYDWLGVSAYA